MPRIGHVNIIGVIVATIAFYFVGALFYGFLFSEAWAREVLVYRGFLEAGQAANLSGQELNNAVVQMNPDTSGGLAMGIGFLNALVSVIALAIARSAFKAFSMGSALKLAVGLWAGFVVTTLAYDAIYVGEPLFFFFVDAAHLFVAFIVGMVVLSLFD